MEEGWQWPDEQPVALVPGSSTTSGYAFARLLMFTMLQAPSLTVLS